MELQKLRYFYTVARLQHMTRAAEQLRIAQPALSQAVKSLELELGVPLFVKRGRNIALTECGAHLRDRLETLLPEIDGLPAELAQLQSRVNKTVRINILAASLLAVNAIVSYRQQNQEVLFDLEQSMQEHDCDIVITSNGAEDRSGGSCLRRCVKKERIYLAVPKGSAYAALETVDLRDLREEGFVMLSNAKLFGILCGQFCAAAGFAPKILFESDSRSAVQNIISAGIGVAFWPEYAWGPVDRDRITLLPIAYPLCEREIVIELHERLPRSAYAEEFFDCLIQQI